MVENHEPPRNFILVVADRISGDSLTFAAAASPSTQCSPFYDYSGRVNQKPSSTLSIQRDVEKNHG
jgi:hypothetical protein